MCKILALLAVLSTPITAMCDALTDADINHYLETLPKAAVPLDQLQGFLKDGDSDIADKIMKANMQGKGMRTAVDVAKDTPEIEELKGILRDGGYNSIEEWALIADRIGGVMFAAQWVVMTARMPIPNQPEPDIAPGANLFEYFKDDSKSPKYRKEYKEQLDGLCTDYCFDVADIPVVGPRFDEIAAALKASKP